MHEQAHTHTLTTNTSLVNFYFFCEGIKLPRTKNIKHQSQERFDVQLQGRAGHVQLEPGDDVRVEDSEVSDALPPSKNLRTATREKGGV